MTEFKCNECDKIFYSEEALQQHNVAKHQKQNEQKPKRSIKASYAAAVIVVILIAIGAYLAATYTPPKYDMKTAGGEKFLGNENATVTMTEFSDFECPFCARFAVNTEPQIVSDYVNTGKVKLVYKEFPLASHPNAEKAAEAAECAFDMGGNDAFWKMNDKMFHNNELLSDSNLKRFAAEIGLNMTDFNACLDSGVMRARVQQDMNEGQQLGMTSTPTFFINDRKIEGACPYDSFSKALDAQIAGKTWSQGSNCDINVS